MALALLKNLRSILCGSGERSRLAQHSPVGRSSDAHLHRSVATVHPSVDPRLLAPTMGYFVVSDTVLSEQDLVNVLWDANILDPENENVPLDHLMKANGWDLEEEFYVQRLKMHKLYEYLILTMDELRLVLRFTSNYKCTRAALCKMLRGG